MAINTETHAFLYSVVRGRFTVQEGYLRNTRWSSERLRFRREGYHTERSCASQEGAIYSGCLWLAERDDNKARELLIAHEKSRIAELKEKNRKPLVDHRHIARGG
jgi:hypothetical protein